MIKNQISGKLQLIDKSRVNNFRKEIILFEKTVGIKMNRNKTGLWKESLTFKTLLKTHNFWREVRVY